VSTIPNNQFAFFSGMSQACPHVSGVAALVWSRFPDKTAQDIWQALTALAEDLGPEGPDVWYGYGLVQAAAAVDYLAGGGSVPAPSPFPPPLPNLV
jgi:serine protease